MNTCRMVFDSRAIGESIAIGAAISAIRRYAT